MTAIRCACLAASLMCACAESAPPVRTVTGADPARGLALAQEAGCAACHTIPGIDWPEGRAGPPLEGFANQVMIGGRHPNQPAVLIAWLQNAPALSPATAMPPMPLTEAEARDLAAYLYTLDAR
jgi:L-cysteine S-thiosulfotransferase